MTLTPEGVRAWLRTPEGEDWHRTHHRPASSNLASIKHDHECDDMDAGCFPHAGGYMTDWIKEDISKYGMNGVPPAWRKSR